MNQESVYDSIFWHCCLDDKKKPVYSLNFLHDGFRRTMKASAWKEEPQRFETDWLSEINQLGKEWKSRTYTKSPSNEFILNERGKIRLIHGDRVRDRVMMHTLCDHDMTPNIKPYLIHNNGASQEGKGISFARKMFENDLHSYWIENGTNEGHVGFLDFSKFYDNIQHEKIKEVICPKISEDGAWLLGKTLKTFEVDVSYMSDEEYARCLDEKYDSAQYHFTIPKACRTSEKMMPKSVDIGNQASQDIGVAFPIRVDNYVKIVRGCNKYGRYMDDIYVICETKEEIQSIFEGIAEIAKELGLFINDRKTRIVKLSENYKYLQIRYSLQDNGRVIKKVNPKSVTRERRKIKAYKRQLDKGIMTMPDIENSFKSWLCGTFKYMSNQQILNMLILYLSLFGGLPTWKKTTNSKLRWMTVQCLKISGLTETTTLAQKNSQRMTSKGNFLKSQFKTIPEKKQSLKMSS